MRVTAVQPAGDVTIAWRYGGEAQGGPVARGTLSQGLALGEWTRPIPLADLVKGAWPPPFQGRFWYLTFMVNDARSRGLQMEFEFAYRGKTLKTIAAAGPEGGTVGLVVPHYRLAGGKTPDDPEFLAELCGLKEYAAQRAEFAGNSPWAKGPRPRRFMIVTDVSGYGEGIAYGIRHNDRGIVEAEMPTLRAMGVNGFRAAPAFLREMASRHVGWAGDLGRGEIATAMGFPVPSYREGRATNDPECGCPFGAKVPQQTAEGVAAAVARALAIPVPEVWSLTIDEIGSVFDHAAEGKKHMESCARCVEAFRQYARELGAVPEDFGRSDWSAVGPCWEGGPKATTYYTRKFNNFATAKLFTPLRDAFEAENARKRQALARGDQADPAARQPWIYSYALRGNTFLMAGHSLDFFDFYRHADNAFMYETSNRGWQIWQWDSYLCDVGRTLTERMNKPFGIIIKPHRGAPVQRTLAAVTRGARLLYWYTYGPDYFKGDSFAGDRESVAAVVKVAHLLGKTEDVLWESRWARPAEIAIVKPRCSEFLGSDAAWENAKWVYTALAHAHLPIDAIDEVMLAEDDLSRYKIVYVNGSHLPRRAAEGLARYVAQGGVLWTSGGGCARDEADEPLAPLAPVLGLKSRAAPELWTKVERYRATAVQSFADSRARLAPAPEGARVTGSGPYAGSLPLVVGREVLQPGAATEVLARYADGGAAMTVHRHGRGTAYVAGFFPGLEYSVPLRDGPADMSRDFPAIVRNFIAAPALAVTSPVVEPSVPAVEGVLLKHPSGKHAVALMNWAYRLPPTGPEPQDATRPAPALVEHENLSITLRGLANVRSVTSAMLDRPLAIERRQDAITVTLPALAEGDVLLVE